VFAAGYDGFVDLELLGPTVEAEGYESAIRRGMRWLDATLQDLTGDRPRAGPSGFAPET
jgi:hypothetical protein